MSLLDFVSQPLEPWIKVALNILVAVAFFIAGFLATLVAEQWQKNRQVCMRLICFVVTGLVAGGFLQYWDSVAPEKGPIDFVRRSGTRVLAGTREAIMWQEDLHSEIVFDPVGPVDLTGDGRGETIVVTRPRDGDQLLILDREGRKIFDSNVVGSIIVAENTNEEVRKLWPAKDGTILTVSSQNLALDDLGRPVGLKVDGRLIALETGFAFVEDLFQTWGGPPGGAEADKPYFITDVKTVAVPGSTNNFIIAALEPRTRARYSGIMILRLKMAASGLLEVLGGVYWHPGPLQISSWVNPELRDFGGPLIVARGENSFLAEIYSGGIAVLVALNGGNLSGKRCWNLTKEDFASLFNLEEGVSVLDRGCFDMVPSTLQPWYRLAEPPVQLWYKWIEPPGTIIDEARIETSPPSGPSFPRSAPPPSSGYSVVARTARDCRFEVEAVYGYTINSPWGLDCAAGMKLRPTVW